MFHITLLSARASLNYFICRDISEGVRGLEMKNNVQIQKCVSSFDFEKMLDHLKKSMKGSSEGGSEGKNYFVELSTTCVNI